MAKLTEDERLFRKIEDKIKRAIFDYGLINDGDRILVGLSGGKDSLALVDLLGRRPHSLTHWELVSRSLTKRGW